MSIVLSGDGTITGLTTTGISSVQKLPAGSVLQVVQATYTTVQSTSSNSPVTTNFSASITPSSSSNKILIISNLSVGTVTGSNGVTLQIWRGGSSIFQQNLNAGYLSIGTSVSENHINNTFTYLDSPATTSSVTYTQYFASSNSGTVYFCVNSNPSTMTLMEIAA
jgi:hypothetical protein